MANQYKNKVVYNGATLIDLSDTTAVQSDVASGKYFYLATGEKVVGTASGGGGDEPSEPTYETYFDDSINVGEYGISIASLADLYFAEGETWRVTWDGVEYLCTTTQYQGWLWAVGNQSLASTDDGVNEPFLLYNYGGSAMNGNARTGGTHTLKLEKQTSSGGGGGGGSTNPLSGKILSATGDSIAAGAGNNGSGYPELVASDNNMTLQNIAVGGGTIAYINANTFCISRSISNMRSDADFVLLEGGGNDADSGVPLGTLSSGYTATLDDTTFAGAIESMFKAALARFPDKKIGYVFIHKCASLFDSRVSNSYYDMAKSACEKWGIPYLDLNTQVPPLNYIADLKSTYTANADGYHPNELGYRTFYVPKITAFLNTMLTDNSLINKIVTANGTYIASDDDADGYSSVTVNVSGGGGDEPVTPTETLLGQTPYTLTEDANIRLKSTSETTYSTGSGVVKDFDDRENQTLTSATLTEQGTYWELADDGAASWYASMLTFTISGLTVNNTYTARIGAAGDGTTSISGYWSIYNQSASALGDTPLVSQTLDITDGALQFTPTESTILVRVLPSDSYYWDQGVKTSRFSYFRIEGEVSGTFTGSVDLGQLSSGTTITSTPSCDVYAVIGSSGGTLSGKTCVCLGDSVTGLMAPPNDYPSVLASNTGMTVINGGFEGCRMSDTHPSATYAAFSAVKLADAIATGIWTTQDANIGGFESGSYAPAHLTALKAVNWSNVDYITVEFGGNDAGDQYVYIDNTQNPTDTTTYVGAARYVYNRIHAAYPNIKIMFFVPMYRYWISEGKDSDEMTFTLGGNTYHYYDWGDALIASPPASGVPVIDMYRTLGINASNRTTYLLTSDQTHPSVAGCELIAQKFQTELTNHFLPSGGGSSATLITKTITVNGIYSAEDDNADGYSSVTVNVPSSGITPTGSINITTNGTHDVTNYASAVVNISSGGIETENIVPEQSINCTISVGNVYGGYINQYSERTQNGSYYLVTLNGTEYIARAFYASASYLILGDNRIYDGADNQYIMFPFLIVNESNAFYLSMQTSGAYTLKIDKILSWN